MSEGEVQKKQAKVQSYQAETGGKHSYTEEETVAFVDYINSQLKDDKDLAHIMPLSPDGLFEGVKDGILLCKLINAAVPGTIDERVINAKGPKTNTYERIENHNLTVNSAKAIGCSTVNVGNNDLQEGRPHIVLGLVWQIIKIGLLADINLKAHPELVRLLREGETLEDLLKLGAEELLLRWFNYQLDKAGHSRRVKNFTSDIQDSENYTVLLKQISNGVCDATPLSESDTTQRAEKMLQQADKIGCRKFVSPKDVVKGNAKLNLAYVANLFNNYPALEPIDESEYDFASLLDFDSEGSREERAFRFWIQSLGIDVNNLFEDAKDGLVLLKVEDKVQPGIVDWKKVDMAPKNKFSRVGNCNKVVECAGKMNLSTVNIGGTDVEGGNKKIVLAIVWQLMRQNLLKMLTELGGGQKVTDDDLVKWANAKVGDVTIDSFKDPSLKTGYFLCRLCQAVSPKSVNTDFITPGETPEDAEKNAKYAISVARKIGATVFLLWEDITEVKSKMILTFIAALNIAEKQGLAKK